MTRNCLSAAFALSLSLAALAPAASAAESSILSNQQTGLCAYPLSSVSDDYVYSTTCNADASQMWSGEVVGRLSNGAAYMRLRNKLTGLCADLETASTVNGVKIVQRACSASTTQQWSATTYVIYSVPNGIGPSAQPNMTVVNRYSSKCLEAPTDNTGLRQGSCGSSNYLKWFFAL